MRQGEASFNLRGKYCKEAYITRKTQKMTYQFDDEETLGKAIESAKPFCKLTKKMDVPEEKYIVGDFEDFDKYPGLVGRKWSRLCGFTFKSKNGEYFQFVYVPKLKGTLSRNQKALSGWYCWTLFSKDAANKQVTSIEEMHRKFGFDINKFVHSDYFDKWVAVFKSNINYALDNQVKELLSRPENAFNDYKELVRYVQAVRDSIAKIDEVKQFVTPETKYDDRGAPDYAKGSAPKIGHAKIAYNADKTYDLRNTSQMSQEELKKKAAIEKIVQRLNAKKDEPIEEQPGQQVVEPKMSKKKEYIRVDPSLKYKFGGGRTKKADSEIFDKYDDYDNDDFR